MTSKFLPLTVLSLAALALMGGRCAPPASPEVQEEPISESAAQVETAAEAPAEVPGVAFVPYENRAMNYTLDRPDKWYWRHYLGSQVKDKAPGVEDYFIADPAPLPDIGSGYLGRMVIEVTKRNASEYAEAVSGLTEAGATVGGEAAKRYAGVKDDNDIIEYHFSHGGFTYRVRYQAPADSGDESVFERLVASLEFGS